MIINKDDHILLQNTLDLCLNNQGCSVELIIRPECNQRCEYCYITQYGDKSYPYHLRGNNQEITENVSLLMKYFKEKKYFIRQLDLFAGDMFYDNLFFEIMPYIFNYYKYMTSYFPDLLDKNTIKDELGNIIEPVILIPSNMSFCADDEKIIKTQKIVDEFAQMGIRIYFSYSSDGIYATDIREKREVQEEFFDKVLAFCSKNNWGVHPMISYESINCAIDNYEWWKKKFKQHKFIHNTIPCFLEVRNPGWTQENIEKYKQFLIYVLNDTYKEYNCNVAELFEYHFRNYAKQDNYYQFIGDTGYSLTKFNIHRPEGTSTECGLSTFDICINCGDLRIVPCHRLAYPQLSGGKFIKNQNNTQIINIEANENLNGYLNLISMNDLDKPKCYKCAYKALCMKGCPGAQYEYFGDPYISIPNVCEFLMAKYKTTMEFYHNIGMFHYIFTNYKDYPDNKIYYNLLIELGYEEYKKYSFKED